MASALETESGEGEGEMLDVESSWRLSAEKSVSVKEMVEPWQFSLKRAMQVEIKSAEITEGG
jgi:hypothetical protein